MCGTRLRIVNQIQPEEDAQPPNIYLGRHLIAIDGMS